MLLLYFEMAAVQVMTGNHHQVAAAKSVSDQIPAVVSPVIFKYVSHSAGMKS